MNKNGIIIGVCGVVLTGIGYGLYKAITKKSEEPVEEVKEEVKETATEAKGDDFLQKMMDEYDEDCKATENWTEREAAYKKEMSEKASLKDQNMFTDDVSESKEFEALNKIREASGKEPIQMNKKFEKFLGKDSESKSLKESIDNIAEGIKKDPELKKRVLNILQE